MTRDIVGAERSEWNRGDPPGRYTFHAPIPPRYQGVVFTVACLRLGDHAHLDVESGRAIQDAVERGPFRRATRGGAGRLVLSWEQWLVLREILDAADCVHIAEVENPTRGQLDHHVGEQRQADPVRLLLDGLEVASIRELKRLVDTARREPIQGGL